MMQLGRRNSQRLMGAAKPGRGKDISELPRSERHSPESLNSERYVRMEKVGEKNSWQRTIEW